jgi:hypothetical protein
MKNILLQDECFNSFGEYVKARREALGKSIRGLASELDMTPILKKETAMHRRNISKKWLRYCVSQGMIPTASMILRVRAEIIFIRIW